MVEPRPWSASSKGGRGAATGGANDLASSKRLSTALLMRTKQEPNAKKPSANKVTVMINTRRFHTESGGAGEGSLIALSLIKLYRARLIHDGSVQLARHKGVLERGVINVGQLTLERGDRLAKQGATTR